MCVVYKLKVIFLFIFFCFLCVFMDNMSFFFFISFISNLIFEFVLF